MTKTLASKICFLLILVGLHMPLQGSAPPLPARTGIVNDKARVIDAATASRITALSNDLYEKTGARVTVLTIDSLNGDDIRSFANQVFHAWGIGKKGSDRGVLILLAVKERRYRVEVGYGLESILPDGKVGGFGREAVPFFKQTRYGDAIELLTDRIAATIATDSHVALSGSSEAAAPASTAAQSRPAGKPPIWGLALMVAFIAVPVVMFAVFLFFIYKLATSKSIKDWAATNAGSSSGLSGSSFSDSSSSSDSGSSDSGGFSGGDSGGGGADGSF